MLAVMSSDDVFDDIMIIEDLDVIDETQIRKVIAEVEAVASSGSAGLRVSVLTTEQWSTVVKRMLRTSLPKGAELYVHIVRDKREPLHLLVSPSAVKGINEGSRHMYQEVVYTSLRCLPTVLPRPLRRGVDDLIASEISRRMDIDIFVRNYPRESELVKNLMEALAEDYGYSMLDWAVVFRRSPDRVVKALSKSSLKITEEFALELAKDPINWEAPPIVALAMKMTEAKR